MPVTSKDVALRAGVSQPTVSRALRGDRRITEDTRVKVEKAAAELGYVPSELGRSLATRTTRRIAMIADLDNPLYPLLVPPLHDVFAEHGYRMVLLAERGDDKETFDELFDQSVDGAVLTTSLTRSSLPLLLKERRVPFVQVNRVSRVLEADAVVADNEAGARVAGQLLLDHGHTRVAALLGPEETSTSADRETGFRAALSEGGLDLPDHRICRGWFTYKDGAIGFRHLMAPKLRPTAVFCVNDIVAIGALNAAMSLGIKVPADVSLVGFDGLDIASWPFFRLTTVEVDFESIARRAALLLLARLDGEGGAPVREVVPVNLILRATHGPASLP